MGVGAGCGQGGGAFGGLVGAAGAGRGGGAATGGGGATPPIAKMTWHIGQRTCLPCEPSGNCNGFLQPGQITLSGMTSPERRDGPNHDIVIGVLPHVKN